MYQPHFSASDYENMFPIRANSALNNSEQGFQVLYAEKDWPYIAASLVADGHEQYAYGYDGYTFYQTMSWDSQGMTSTGQGRGLFTAILDPPAYSGWVCYRKSNGEYDCKAQYLRAGGLDDNTTAPDLRKNNYDIETGWSCVVDTESNDWKDTVECIYYMPNEAEEYEYGQYRWSPFGLAHKRVTNVP